MTSAAVPATSYNTKPAIKVRHARKHTDREVVIRCQVITDVVRDNATCVVVFRVSDDDNQDLGAPLEVVSRTYIIPPEVTFGTTLRLTGMIMSWEATNPDDKELSLMVVSKYDVEVMGSGGVFDHCFE